MWPTGKSSQPLAAVTSLRGSLAITSLVTWHHILTYSCRFEKVWCHLDCVKLAPGLIEDNPENDAWVISPLLHPPEIEEKKSSLNVEIFTYFSLGVFPGKVLLVLFLDLGHVGDAGEVLPHEEPQLVSPVIPPVTLC